MSTVLFHLHELDYHPSITTFPPTLYYTGLSGHSDVEALQSVDKITNWVRAAGLTQTSTGVFVPFFLHGYLRLPRLISTNAMSYPCTLDCCSSVWNPAAVHNPYYSASGCSEVCCQACYRTLVYSTYSPIESVHSIYKPGQKQKVMVCRRMLSGHSLLLYSLPSCPSPKS